jgi:hypothetical protein
MVIQKNATNYTQKSWPEAVKFYYLCKKCVHWDKNQGVEGMVGAVSLSDVTLSDIVLCCNWH